MLDTLTSRRGAGTIPITCVVTTAYDAWLRKQSGATKAWLGSVGFKPESGNSALLPGKGGKLGRVVLAMADAPDPWCFAALPGKLPAGRYAFDGSLPDAVADTAALGWAFAGYRFDRYRSASRNGAKAAVLVWPAGCDRAEVERAYTAVALGRDLISTPAQDLGPAELADAIEKVGGRHKAKVSVVRGDALLAKGYPAIHAVGRGSEREPCLIDLRWGDAKAKKLTLVGKGVCFDTGGYNIKDATGMRWMKKDMGGAASVLALADMIMDAALPVRLRVLVPAVENSISGRAYRPGDVVSTRKGKSIEIGNTDAEGRVVLADALTEADSEDPDVIVDFATLTGAARIALGTELPALFCDDDAFCQSVLAAGQEVHDPLWRMPLFAPYRRHLDSKIADLNNMPSVGTGGAITAALFLEAFIAPKRRWAHVDTMAFYLGSRPGRPEGGEVFGVRAFYRALAERYAE